MGINWGIALGSAVNNGVNTYTKLQENSRQQEAEARAQEEFEWKKKEQEDALKLADIQSRTIGAGDTKQVTDQAAIQDLKSNYNQYQGEDGPAVPTKAIEYSDADKRKDFYTQAAAAGINPTKVQQAALGHLQYQGALRNETRAAAEDDHSKWLSNSLGQIEAGDIKGFVAANKDAVLKAYNVPKKGSRHDDGLTADIVADASGNNYSFVQMDKDGKVVRSTPIDATVARSVLPEIAFAKYQALPGKYKDAEELALKRGELDVKREANDIHREFYGKDGTFERVHNLQAKVAGGKSRAVQMEEEASALATLKVKTGEINPKTNKPYTPDEAKLSAYRDIMTRGKEAPEWKYNNEGTVRSNSAGVSQRLDEKTNTWITSGLPKVNEAAAKAGVVADVDKNGRVGYKGADGWYTSEQDAYTSWKNAPKAKSPSASPDEAIPTEDSKKYLRSKNPRGGYTYTVSPRGLTKQQYAEMDRSN